MVKLTSSAPAKEGSNKPNGHSKSDHPNATETATINSSAVDASEAVNTPKSSNGRKNQPEFSHSINAAVCSAAETARIVLDQAIADVASDNESQGRRGSHSSHSESSRRSRSPHNRLSIDGMSLSGGEEEAEELEELRMKYKKEWFENSKVATGGEGMKLLQEQKTDSACDEPTHWPNALSGAPADRKGTDSINQDEDPDEKDKIDKSPTTDTNDSTENSTKDAVIAASTPPPGAFNNLPMMRGLAPSSSSKAGIGEEDATSVFTEVTNKFDAAAAVSAALASSHLAQASGGVGGLQLSQANLQKKTSSEGEGDGDEESSSTPPRKLVEPKAHFSEAKPFQNSSSRIEEEPSSSDHTKRGEILLKSLPTPEQAASEVAARRLSFMSDDDEPGKVHDTRDITGEDKGSENDKNESKSETTAERNAEFSNMGEKSVDDSISCCSSSGFESNTSSMGCESNTSSMYGSDISPITMSVGTGDGMSSGEDRRKVGGGGMLGNLKKSCASIANDEEHNAELVDNLTRTGNVKYNGRDNLNPRRHNSVSDEKVEKVENELTNSNFALQSVGPALTPSSKPLRMLEGSDLRAQISEVDGHVVDGWRKRKTDRRNTALLPDHQHHLSLFESFDRNWEQSIQGKLDVEKEQDFGRRCLASFAIVFGECRDSSCFDYFGRNKSDSKRRISSKDNKSKFNWWIDDDAIGTIHEGNTVKSDRDDSAEGMQQMIPTVVVRSMWKACVFSSNDFEDDKVADVLDSIQNVLVNELCYIAQTSTPSTTCLRLSLDIYSEYGWYILRRYLTSDGTADSIEKHVETWHSKFASYLHRLLLGDGRDFDSTILQRYAARTLPRHTAFGITGVDSNGCFIHEFTPEKRCVLRVEVFEKLLCSRDFIKLRVELLGRGKTRCTTVDEDMSKTKTSTQLVEFIKTSRDDETNVLLPTRVHVKDIEWCAPLCYFDLDIQQGGCATIADCLDALMAWRRECTNRFISLYNSGKISLYGNDPAHCALKSRVKLTLSSSESANNLGGVPGDCTGVAKSLLSKEDAWTMKDNSAYIFKDDSIDDNPTPRKPPKKGRRKRNHGKIGSTSLARILGINISDLRASISIGRSLLCLSEFSRYSLERGIFQGKGGTNFVTSRLREEQSYCLNDSIQILSSSATTLFYILSSPLDNLEEDDIDDTVATSFGPNFCLQKFALVRDATKPLLTLTGILSADAWYSLGTLVNETNASAGKSTKISKNVSTSKQAMLSSFERALLILSSSKSSSLTKMPAEPIVTPLSQYKFFLQSNINHAVGVILYEVGIFDKAAGYLNESIRFRRELLEDLQDKNSRNSGITSLLNSVVGAVKKSPLFSTPASVDETIFLNVMKYSINHSCCLLPKQHLDKSESDDMELSLSLTLEYAALTKHAAQSYQAALSLFQEALILRTMHVGKSSLDVASLHFNMGVVHDDLQQYESAISRYNESLRIRSEELNHATPSRDTSELEESVLLTLKCMGHVYKVVNDVDNAVPCYVKALEMLTKKMTACRRSVDEWTKMGLRLDLAIPVPTIIFSDMKKSETDESLWKHHFQAINKKALCHHFSERENSEPPKSRNASTMSKLRKELIKTHTTVIALIQQKKHEVEGNISRSPSAKLPISSVLFAPGGDVFEAALMNSSFQLGRMRLEQGRYEEAANHFEVSLRSKWVLDPSSSSDSDSDFSSRSHKRQPRSISEEDPEEGQLYYALGISNAAMDDHERAVRCFLTSLRYLRRSSRMVDSIEVARVLFDTATSYYYLCDFEQALSHWNDCLRILKAHTGGNDKADDSEYRKSMFRRGIILYCLASARNAIADEYQPEIIMLLNESRSLLSSSKDNPIAAYLDFMTGHFIYQTASQIPVRLRPQLPRNIRLSPSTIDGLSWDGLCQEALALFEKVKAVCWFEPSMGAHNGNEIRNLPLSAHLCLKRGQVYEIIGEVDKALDSYMDAINMYRIACGHINIYAASVLHSMGVLCAHSQGRDHEHHALGYFNEALTIRKSLLGGNDRRVADSLYCSAIVLARLNRYESSMERYHEALRIQMSVVGQSSNEVALTLAGMGLCHYSHRAFELSLTCLVGALKVRKHRISRLTGEAERAKTIEDNFGTTSSSIKSFHFFKLDNIYDEEVALGVIYFNLGNVYMQLGDHSQAMQHFIQARDLRWRHVGGGSTDKILDRYLFGNSVDEDELLGLAHCLHNIGVLFDIKKDYKRSLPHYEEALAIKNAIAGYVASDSAALLAPAAADANDSGDLVMRSLDEDIELPEINKATFSAAMTRTKMASVYAKRKQYELALFHYSHALRIQRQVLGRDHFITSLLLTNMGNVLRRTPARNTETAIMCYNESLRISRVRFGPNHERVASALFNLGGVYDSRRNFDKAVQYYVRALSVYKSRYAQDLRRRLCAGFEGPMSQKSFDNEENGPVVLSTGDEVILKRAAASEEQIREQYMLVTKALRNAAKQDMIQRGGGTVSYSGSNDWWLTFEVLLFRFVEMLSNYVVDPTQAAVRNTIETTRQKIESAAHHAIITAKDALDYNFLLMLQE